MERGRRGQPGSNALRAELAAMSLRQCIRRAEEMGVDDERIDAAEEAADTKGAIVALILEVHERAAAAEAELTQRTAARASARPAVSGTGTAAGGAANAAASTAAVVVFDWDCTVTSRHMFKTLAGWDGYSAELSAWCDAQGITDPLSIPMDFSICERMQFGGGAKGDALLRTVFIEFFMGGEKRATEIKDMLTTLRADGATLCVLTRGETHSLHVLFDTVLRDWAVLFEGGWIGNTLNDFFTVSSDGTLSSVGTGLSEISGECTKQQLLESLFPFTEHRVLLVDDDISPETNKVIASSAPGADGGTIAQLDLPLEMDGLQPTSMKMVLSIVSSLGSTGDAAAAAAAAAAVGNGAGTAGALDRSLPVEVPAESAAAAANAGAGPASMMPQQQRGFTALQALVQRGGLEEMQRVLSQRDDDGDGFLSLYDMRAVLTDPSTRNAKASEMAAGWPVAEGADYRRMAVGEPGDYRRLGHQLGRPTASRPYYLTEEELEDVVLLAARDVTGRKIHYRELVELGASLLVSKNGLFEPFIY
jgi:hypothetical protein